LDYRRLPRSTRKFYIQREIDLRDDTGAYDEGEDTAAEACSEYHDNGDYDEDGNVWCDECEEWHADE
jgi:hypothetical protein